MKFYFLSSQPCALTVNDVFYGVTDGFERSLRLSPADNLYIRFSPEGAHPVGFFLTEEIRRRPPAGCEVYLVKDGVVIFANDFPPVDFTLQPVAQKREGKLLATVFRQGKLQLSVEGEKGYFNATLPPSFANCGIEFRGELLLLKGKTTLGIFTQDCQPLLIENYLDYEIDGEVLRATLPLTGGGRKAKCAWQLTENSCTLTEFTLQEEGRNPPSEGLLAYAFFESVLLKGNYADFLCEELQTEKEKIVAFLGEFISVTLTESPTECGLVRKKGERLFEVDYFSVEIREGKITDVRG